MASLADLKHELPMGLQNDLGKQMLPGEATIISLPGSFGEAFVVTDRRAIIIRDRGAGLNTVCDIFGYPLAKVTGAAAISSGVGGYIELNLTEPVTEQDSVRVYFPSYESDKFKAAADYLAGTLKPPESDAEAAQSPRVAGISSQFGAGTCSKCGAKIEQGVAFCQQCGAQISAICAGCGGATPFGSAYCCNCGVAMLEFPPQCPTCGKRVRFWMIFCPDCGTYLHPQCMECGTRIQPEWKYCASCGRRIGSDQINPRSTQASMRRLQQLKETRRTSQDEPEAQPVVTPAPAAAPAPAVTSSLTSNSAAEEHNAKGRELFDNDDIEAAISEFEIAVSLDPGNASYHSNLAVAYDELERDDEALVEYNKALSIDPNDLTALLSLGYMYSEKAEFEKAKEVWDRVLEIAPQSAEAQEVRDNLRHQGEL